MKIEDINKLKLTEDFHKLLELDKKVSEKDKEAFYEFLLNKAEGTSLEMITRKFIEKLKEGPEALYRWTLEKTKTSIPDA